MIRLSGASVLVVSITLLMSACGGNAALEPIVTPPTLQPSRPAEPNPGDVLASVTPRPALLPGPETPAEEVLAPLRSAVAEFPEPPGVRNDVTCRREQRSESWCELGGLADAGAVEAFDAFTHLASAGGWVPEGSVAEETTDTLYTRKQFWHRDPLRLTVNTGHIRGTWGSSYKLTITPQKRRIVSSAPPQDVRQAWADVTSGVEGYHSPACAALDPDLTRTDRYTCSSTAPLSIPYAAFFNQIGQTLTDQQWVPTTERPVFEHSWYVWSFRRDGLSCTLEVGPRGPASFPPFVHVRVEALAD